MRLSFVPPQPWKMPTTGNGPSPPAGNATATSIGTPSQLVIWAVPVPQRRWPLAWTVQLIGVAVFVKTWGIAASAVDGTIRAAAAHAAAASILRIVLSSLSGTEENLTARQLPRKSAITALARRRRSARMRARSRSIRLAIAGSCSCRRSKAARSRRTTSTSVAASSVADRG